MIMEIIIRNRIKIDQQEELVKEIYQGELKKGEHQTLLKYQNAANEKVLLKFDENEVIMTRFAKRPIKMHFHPEIPLPLKILTTLSVNNYHLMTTYNC